MATSNDDRISSTKLATFATKLWTKLKSTFQTTISDLATIRSNASAGAAKVSCTDATVGGFGYTKNAGTVTSVVVKMNNTTKGTITSSGTIDLGTVITDISGKQDKLPTSGDLYDIGVTASVVATTADKADYAIKVEDYGATGHYVYCGWQGTSIASVTPDASEAAQSGTHYLIAAFKQSDTVACYKDVEAGNVTVGKAKLLSQATCGHDWASQTSNSLTIPTSTWVRAANTDASTWLDTVGIPVEAGQIVDVRFTAYTSTVCSSNGLVFRLGDSSDASGTSSTSQNVYGGTCQMKGYNVMGEITYKNTGSSKIVVYPQVYNSTGKSFTLACSHVCVLVF